jgi:hypothetical protein
VFHKTKWPTSIQIPCARKGQILFCEKNHSDSTNKFSETDVIKMPQFLNDNIFVIFGGRRHTYGYKLCSSSRRLIPLFVWGWFHKGASQEKQKKKLFRSFNFTLRFIHDVLSLNNSRFGDFVCRIYPIELEIKDTTDTDRSASYLDLHLEIGSERWLRTKLCDKRDDFNFPIIYFPFIYSNIPAAPAYYGVYISLLMRYSRACDSYQDLLDRGLLLTRKQLNKGFLLVKLKSSFRKFYGRHHNLIDRYEIFV